MSINTAPMALLEISRMVQDEGAARVLKIFSRLLINPSARARVRSMRNIFRKHHNNMQAFVMVVEKQKYS